MAKGKKRKLLFLVVRVVVTVGLLGFIYTKIEFRDKVFLKSGDVLEGKLVEWDDERVVIVVQGETEPRLIPAEDVALR